MLVELPTFGSHLCLNRVQLYLRLPQLFAQFTILDLCDTEEILHVVELLFELRQSNRSVSTEFITRSSVAMLATKNPTDISLLAVYSLTHKNS
eukprot:9067867-Pyramimonas_sp.AAC.3